MHLALDKMFLRYNAEEHCEGSNNEIPMKTRRRKRAGNEKNQGSGGSVVATE
jgi:hypothetical protein